MSKRDPHDPDGEYEGRNCTREDCFCSQEGYFMIETQDEPISADITTLGDDACAGEFAREKTVEHILGCALEEITDAIEATKDYTQGLIATRSSLALYLNMLSDAHNGPRNTF